LSFLKIGTAMTAAPKNMIVDSSVATDCSRV
jgi:hypothetical protein